MRVLTWNVNGLRAVVRKYGGLQALLESLQADIICLQETKLAPSELTSDIAICTGWDAYFSMCRGKQGYSGVATFCRISATTPMAAEEGLTGCLHSMGSHFGSPALFTEWSSEETAELDDEGRAVLTDHGAFVVINLYGPALSMEENFEQRFRFKLRFYEALEARITALQRGGRHVIVVGDFNISPLPIDSCDPGPNFGKRTDRQWLQRLLQRPGGPECPGLVLDAFRACHPQRREAYTCWSVASGARVNNYGTRIDLVLLAGAHATPEANLRDLVAGSDIMASVLGSDHAPCWMDIKTCSVPVGLPPAPLSARRRFPGKQASLKDLLQATSSTVGTKLTGQHLPMEEPSVAALHLAPASQGICGGSTVKPGARPQPKKQRTAAQQGLRGFLVSAAASSHSASQARGDKEGSQQAGRSSPNDAPQFPNSKGEGNGSQHAGPDASRASSSAGAGPVPQLASSSAPSAWVPPDEASQAWRRIQNRMAPPLCQGHREPCVVRAVKKSGPNNGRVFFVCARAPGKPPEGRCNHFSWANNRTARQGAS